MTIGMLRKAAIVIDELIKASERVKERFKAKQIPKEASPSGEGENENSNEPDINSGAD